METLSVTMKGTITAISDLTSIRKGDNEKFAGDISRMPRKGNTLDSEVYFSAGGITGALRTCTYNAVIRALQINNKDMKQGNLNAAYLIGSGVKLKQVDQINEEKYGKPTKATEIMPGEKNAIRERNPFVSLNGMWGLAARLGIGNAVPVDQENCITIVGEKYRANLAKRNPEILESLSEEEQKDIMDLIVEDSFASLDAKGVDAEIKEVKKELKLSEEKDKPALFAKLEELNTAKTTIKQEKKFINETIQRPVSAYEAIVAGTEMRHDMKLTGCTTLELGILLASLREFSRTAQLGGHGRDNCGEVAMEYPVKALAWDSYVPEHVGTVKVSHMDFQIIDAAEHTLLSDALKAFDEAMKNFDESGLDLTAA